MPETAEFSIMTEFINIEFGHRVVLRVEKNPIVKDIFKCDISRLENKHWKIKARYNGKEMIITFINNDDLFEQHSLLLNFAKVGEFKFEKQENLKSSTFEKSLLRFYTDTEILMLYDFTRMSSWKWTESFSSFRSPDILTSRPGWVNKLYKHQNSREFKGKAVFEVMLNQKYFNGIGTFSRTEILARTKFSPFTPFKDVLRIDSLRNDFFDTCVYTIECIKNLGGFQYKNWKNPFFIDKKPLYNWIKVYKKEDSIFMVDRNGSRFWFEKCWLDDYENWCYSNGLSELLHSDNYKNVDKLNENLKLKL